MKRALLLSAFTFAIVSLHDQVAAKAQQCDAPQHELKIFNDSAQSEDVVRSRAALESGNGMSLIVWGGNRELITAAFRVAQALHDEGLPMRGFVMGPDRNGLEGDAEFEIYVRGRSASGTNGAARIGSDNLGLVWPEIRRVVLAAFRDNFCD